MKMKNETTAQPKSEKPEQKQSTGQVLVIAGGNFKFPDLSKSNPIPVELAPNYWTPENKGETRRVIFLEVAKRRTIQDDEVRDLDTAFFMWKNEKGDWQKIC